MNKAQRAALAESIYMLTITTGLEARYMRDYCNMALDKPTRFKALEDANATRDQAERYKASIRAAGIPLP